MSTQTDQQQEPSNADITVGVAKQVASALSQILATMSISAANTAGVVLEVYTPQDWRITVTVAVGKRP